MHFTTLTAVLAAGLGMAAALPAEGIPADTLKFEARAAAPPANQVQLVDVQYGGTGCPDGSVSKAISDNKDLITLLFDKYTVESGKDVSPSENRRACQLNIKLKYPQGWQFGIFKADYRGFVSLPKKTEGHARATYYFSGDTKQITRDMTFKGPIAQDYTKTDEIGVESLVWSPCGTEGLLNIKSAIDIRPLGSKEPALITVDSIDTKYTQYYHMQWRKC